jgi:2-amino-4-hydroxy-6-hydroxymethyldihydropteridine diphosphokinase
VALVLIALGSNLGDRLGAMQRALDALSPSVRWVKASKVYETKPMYVEDQPAFLNAAVLGETKLGPFALLSLLKATEASIGRSGAERFGPREIDLDLLSYGRLRLSSRREERSLELPHPRLVERRFVLAPLCDVAPDMNLPGMGRVDELLEATKEQAADVIIVNDAVLSVCGDGPSR